MVVSTALKRVEKKKTHARQSQVRLYAVASGRFHLSPTPSSGAPLQDAPIDVGFSSYNVPIGGQFYEFP